MDISYFRVFRLLLIEVCRGGIPGFYYPPEVRRGKYWGLGVFLMQYFHLVNIEL